MQGFLPPASLALYESCTCRAAHQALCVVYIDAVCKLPAVGEVLDSTLMSEEKHGLHILLQQKVEQSCQSLYSLKVAQDTARALACHHAGTGGQTR